MQFVIRRWLAKESKWDYFKTHTNIRNWEWVDKSKATIYRQEQAAQDQAGYIRVVHPAFLIVVHAL